MLHAVLIPIFFFVLICIIIRLPIVLFIITTTIHFLFCFKNRLWYIQEWIQLISRLFYDLQGFGPTEQKKLKNHKVDFLLVHNKRGLPVSARDNFYSFHGTLCYLVVVHDSQIRVELIGHLHTDLMDIPDV